MSFSKFSRNQTGLTHLIVPVFGVVVLIGVIGTGLVIKQHQDHQKDLQQQQQVVVPQATNNSADPAAAAKLSPSSTTPTASTSTPPKTATPTPATTAQPTPTPATPPSTGDTPVTYEHGKVVPTDSQARAKAASYYCPSWDAAPGSYSTDECVTLDN
jgi:cytoskeletal protein RodZ